MLSTSGFASESTSKLDSWIQVWIRALNGRFHWIQHEFGFGKLNSLLVSHHYKLEGEWSWTFRYADDIILLATLEAELQELVDRLDRVSHKYSLLINVDKTKVMASDGIACRILIQNELLE